MDKESVELQNRQMNQQTPTVIIYNQQPAQRGFIADAHQTTSRILNPHNLKVFLQVWGCNIGFGIGFTVGVLILYIVAYNQGRINTDN